MMLNDERLGARPRARRVGLLALALLTLASPARSGVEATWEDYLDHAYVYSAADRDDLRGLLAQATRTIGRSLGEYRAETFPALESRERPIGERDLRRQAIALLLLHRAGEAPDGLAAAARTIDRLEDRLDRPENRYWYHTIHAHRALQEGSAEAFVDQVLTLWLEVISPLEVPFETYRTLALTENGHSGFVRTLPHLYESLARLILVETQTAAIDGDIDPLAAIVRVLADQRVGADPGSVPRDASARDYLDHVVSRLDGSESDGGSLSFTLALLAAERAHQTARSRLAADGFSARSRTAIRDSVAAYQRALRHASTLQGQVAVHTRALRQLGEVFATGERLGGVELPVDVPFRIERAYALHAAMHAHEDDGWERDGYVDAGRDAYVQAMRRLWAEIQDASFNAASYYLSVRDASGELDDESIVHAINHYSRYLHAFEIFADDPGGEPLPSSAWYGAYRAARGIGDGVLFFAGGDASAAQLDEAIGQYVRALGFFPFDRELWATLAVALQRSGRESEFLGIAKPIADRVVHSRQLDRWIAGEAVRAPALESFRRAFANDRSLVYLGFADAERLGALETEFLALQDERERVRDALADTRSERDALFARRAEAHRRATESSGESRSPAPPRVTAAPDGSGATSEASETIARLGVDLERLASSDERLESRIDAISESLPVFKATLGHDDLVRDLAAQRDHPLHELLRRFAEEIESPTSPAPTSSREDGAAWRTLQSWIGGAH